MLLTRRVALNGVWLDELDSRIVINGIEPGEGRENIGATETAGGFGQRITFNRRSTVDIVVRFSLLQHGKSEAGMIERSQLLERVIAWARPGGYLTLNYKPDRRLSVVLVQAPGEGSMREFAKEFTLTFRAYTVPFWEQETAQSAQLSAGAMTGGRLVVVDGSADTQFDAEVVNVSGMTVNDVTINIGNKTMVFSNLGLAGGETLLVDHLDGLVRIRIRRPGSYRSAMAYRSGADDFLVSPGSQNCTFSASRACRVTVSWRARYL